MLNLKDDNGKALPKKVQKRVNDFIDSLKEVPWFSPSPDLKKEDVEKQAKFTLKCFGVRAEIEYRNLKKKEDWVSAWASARDSAMDSARDSAWASARDSAWASARDSAMDSSWDSAWASARDSAMDSSWDSAWASARDSAMDSARDSAWASARDSAWASARDSAMDSSWDSAWASARDSAMDSAWASAWVSALASVEALLQDNKQFNEKYPNGAFTQMFKLWEMGLYPVGVLEENKKFVIYIPPCKQEFPFNN